MTVKFYHPSELRQTALCGIRQKFLDDLLYAKLMPPPQSVTILSASHILFSVSGV